MRSTFLRLVLLAGAVAILAGPALIAADDLSIVPIDATTVGVVHLNEMRTSPISGRLFREADRAAVDGETQRFFRETGLRPVDDVDTVVLAMSPEAAGEEPRALVTFFGRFDTARLTAAIVERGATQKSIPAGTYLVLESEKHSDRSVIAFIDSHLAVAGHEKAVVQALADRKAGGSGFRERAGLAQDLYRIDPAATAWLLVDVPRSSRFKSTPTIHDTSGKSDVLASALQKVAVVAVWAADDKEAIRMGGSAVSSDEETRSMIEDMLRGMLATWRLAVQDKKPELLPVLRRFAVTQRAGAVTIEGSIPGAMLKDWAAVKVAN